MHLISETLLCPKCCYSFPYIHLYLYHLHNRKNNFYMLTFLFWNDSSLPLHLTSVSWPDRFLSAKIYLMAYFIRFLYMMIFFFFFKKPLFNQVGPIEMQDLFYKGDLAKAAGMQSHGQWRCLHTAAQWILKKGLNLTAIYKKNDITGTFNISWNTW